MFTNEPVSIEYHTTQDGFDVAIALYKADYGDSLNPVFTDADVMKHVTNSSLVCTDMINISHDVFDLRYYTTLHAFDYLYMHNLTSYDGDIDHISMNRWDNTSLNLRNISHRQNCLNKPSIGYSVPRDRSFQVQGKGNIPGNIYNNEFDAVSEAGFIESEYKKSFPDGEFIFDFMKWRAYDTNLLLNYYRGSISAEELTYKHVLKYADNAWYYYRYNLKDYFKDNHIPIPEFSLDKDGFMLRKGSETDWLNPIGIEHCGCKYYPSIYEYPESKAYKDLIKKEAIHDMLFPFSFLLDAPRYYKNIFDYYDDMEKNQKFLDSLNRYVDYPFLIFSLWEQYPDICKSLNITEHSVVEFVGVFNSNWSMYADYIFSKKNGCE